MLGDLMERTSLADALDKLQSDVASQSFAGLDALKGWLEASGALVDRGMQQKEEFLNAKKDSSFLFRS